MAVAVDTNILLDILLPDPDYKDVSLSLIIKYNKTSKLIISEIVYGELASQFAEMNILESFLSDAGIFLEYTKPQGLWIAAQAWKKYSIDRDEFLQCQSCGHNQLVRCQECNSIISSRQHIIPDFIIGGHAQEQAERLITRDRGFYRSYFNGLEVECPVI